MAQHLATSETDFDFGTLADECDRVKRNKRVVLLGGAVFMIGVGLFFVIVDLGALATGSLSTLRLLTLLIVLAIVGSCLSVVPGGVAFTRKSARRIRIDDLGLELNDLAGKIQRVAWADPELSFELHDFYQLPDPDSQTKPRCFIRINWRDSPLSRPAFDRLLEVARLHGLSIDRSRGSRWIYSVALVPTVYRVRASPA